MGYAPDGREVMLIRVARGCAGVVCILGTVVLAGWFLDLPQVLSLHPGYATMKANTAVCFVLSGFALAGLTVPDSRAASLASRICSTVVLAIAASTLIEYLGGWNLGLDERLIADPAVPLAQHPGRMAGATAVGFTCAGLGMILHSFHTRTSRLGSLSTLLAASTLTLGITGLLGYAVGFQFLYTYPFRATAIHTAAGLSVLAAGLWVLRHNSGGESGQATDDVRITRLAVGLLAVVAGIAGIATAALVEHEARRVLSESLHLAFENRVQQITTSISLSTSRAEIITTRPNLLKHLRLLRHEPENVAARAVIAGVLQSFGYHGFSGIAAYSPAGEELARFGSFVANPRMEARLKPGGEAMLLWKDGFLLRQRLPLLDSEGPLGAVLAEQPMNSVDQTLREATTLGESLNFLLCQEDRRENYRCFPTEFTGEPFVLTPESSGLPRLLYQAKSEGAGFSATVDNRGHRVVSAYGPVGPLGLVAVLTVDTQDLYWPLARRLFWILGLMAALAACGGLLMRARIRPLAAALERRVQERTSALASTNAHLRESEERFRLMVSNVKDYAIFMLDAEGRVKTWNAGAAMLKGYTDEEVIGTHFSRFYTAEDVAKGLPQWELEQAEREGRFESEGWRVRKDGSRFWANIVVTALYDPDAHLRGFSKITRDLTERMQAEARFRQVVEHSSNGMLLMDREGHIVLLNRSAEALFGYGREELLGRSIECLLPNRVRDRHAALRDGFMRSPSTRPMGVGRDLFAQRKDGSEVPVDVGLAPIQMLEGEHVLATVADITERKRAEAVFRQVVECSPNGLILVDDAGRIVLLNRSAEVLFGYSREELLGKSIECLLPEGVRERHISFRESFVRSPSARPMGVGRDLFARRKDGREVPVEVGLAPIEMPAGKCVLATVVDITERKHIEQALRHLNEELEARVQTRTADLEAANHELEAFSYSVSHDLRAPLRHIDGFAGLLGQHAEASLDDRCRRYLNKISESAKQMGELIDDLLSFSRIGRAELRLITVSLQTLVQDVLKILEPETSGRDVVWVVGKLPEVYADPLLLRLVFQNLIGNALKYTRSKPKARIEIQADELADEFVVSVRDNGMGFDMRYVDRLFGVFQRLHSGIEGTGIGLANVRRIIHRHGGRTWAEGEVDRGACFYFSLPRYPKGVVGA